MKIFSTSFVKDLDQNTIKNQNITSLDLMERAAGKLYSWIISNLDLCFFDKELNTSKNSKALKFIIFAGCGNNGGDALVLARLLNNQFDLDLYVLDSKKYSDDFLANKEKLPQEIKNKIKYISSIDDVNKIDFKLNTNNYICNTTNNNTCIIDGLFGSGLNRPLSGINFDLVNKINSAKDLNIKILSIDIPSGLSGEALSNFSGIIKADITLSFQFPKLSFLLPDSGKFTGNFYVLDIGLDKEIINSTKSNWYYFCKDDAKKIIKHRAKFSHKGTYGNALIFAGKYGMCGAALLCAKACIKSGAGLVTACVQKNNLQIMQTAVPEAICILDNNDNFLTTLPEIEQYSAIAFGPGCGKAKETKTLLENLLCTVQNKNIPLVIDADGLNILAENKDLLNMLPSNTILTPHPKEFSRLITNSDSELAWESSYDRLLKQIDFSKKYNVIVVLKGANSSVSFPDSNVIFNSSGNPGLATAGSGDVLTGIITALLAQGYSAQVASILGTYIHGYAGDLYTQTESEEALCASDIITNLGKAFYSIHN